MDWEALAEASWAGCGTEGTAAPALLRPVDLPAQQPAAPPLFNPMLLLPPSTRALIEAPIDASQGDLHVVMLLLPIALACPASFSLVVDLAA